MRVEKSSVITSNIILVDDVVTRGHTFMASAWHIKDSFPNAEAKAFAALKTVSNEIEFRNLVDPVIGKIVYRDEYDDCLRRP